MQPHPCPKLYSVPHPTVISTLSCYYLVSFQPFISLRQLHQTLTRFVRLRRHEHMRLHQAAQGLKTSDMEWLKRPQGKRGVRGHWRVHSRIETRPYNTFSFLRVKDHTYAHTHTRTHASEGVPRSLHETHQRRVHSLVWWIFTDLVIPLLRMSFYITESEPYKQQVFYYRQAAWVSNMHLLAEGG